MSNRQVPHKYDKSGNRPPIYKVGDILWGLKFWKDGRNYLGEIIEVRGFDPFKEEWEYMFFVPGLEKYKLPEKAHKKGWVIWDNDLLPNCPDNFLPSKEEIIYFGSRINHLLSLGQQQHQHHLPNPQAALPSTTLSDMIKDIENKPNPLLIGSTNRSDKTGE